MDEYSTQYVTDGKDWRHWLEQNFRTCDEVWLVYPRKATGKPRIQYNRAVEEALCFGWIDSTVRRLDDDHTIQRFCPRRAGSTYSQPNVERIRWLLRQGKIHPSVEPDASRVASQEFPFPQDILERIQADEPAWENYPGLPEPYKRIRIAYVEAARKRPAEFEKRLRNFIQHTRRNELVKGYGGIEKYY